LDDKYGIEDIPQEYIKEGEKDCLDFLNSHEDLINSVLSSHYSLDHVAHDFWLTRNHYGAGFWDRELGDVGKSLTDIAHNYREVNLIF
jgi:hypothetical protein